MKQYVYQGGALKYVELGSYTISIDLSELSRNLRKKLLKEARQLKYVRSAELTDENWLICRLRPRTANLHFEQLTNVLLNRLARKLEHHLQATQSEGNRHSRSSHNKNFVKKQFPPKRIPAQQGLTT